MISGGADGGMNTPTSGMRRAAWAGISTGGLHPQPMRKLQTLFPGTGSRLRLANDVFQLGDVALSTIRHVATAALEEGRMSSWQSYNSR
jgi:hypothetical protein